MRWIAVLFLAVFGFAELMAAEAKEPSCLPANIVPKIARDAMWPQTPPHPLPTVTASYEISNANRTGHLRKAAEHLRAAGLNSLADHIRGLSYDPGDGKLPENPGSAKAPAQVMFHIKILELEKEKLRQLDFNFSNSELHDGKRPPIHVGILAALREDGVVQALRQDGLARVIAEPKLVTAIGRPAQFRSGGEIMLWVPGPDGKLVQRPRHCGTSVKLNPRLSDKNDLRLEIRLEHSQVDRTKSVLVAGKKIPGIRVRQIQTGLEMKWGQTVFLSDLEQESPALAGKPTGSTSTAIVSTVILVKAEAIEPMVAASSATSAR